MDFFKKIETNNISEYILLPIVNIGLKKESNLIVQFLVFWVPSVH